MHRTFEKKKNLDAVMIIEFPTIPIQKKFIWPD